MTALIVETTAGEECPVDFQGDTAVLVYFLSFAAAERFGAQHELAQVAAALKRQLRIDLAPLLKFSDAVPEDARDIEELEAIWQDAAPLEAAARLAADAIDGTPKLRELAQDYAGLLERLRELAEIARWAAERAAKVRLTYIL
ncbi:MAG: hypothetical protein HYS09_03575 [Chloroflexi bacterium]|nr:hypothetical protein [Chloroflexota bacterium]